MSIRQYRTTVQHYASLLLVLLPLTTTAFKELPDLGVKQWTCDPAVMAKSKTVPTNVHSVRFADINVVAAMGDSITAGNGANAHLAIGLFKEFRGLSFQIGGDMTLEEHITIPNVLKKFNPNVFGYSTGTGRWYNWDVSKLNMAVPGSKSQDMPLQALRLVDAMRNHSEIDIVNHWKLVNIFVGGNDACDACFSRPVINAHTFKENLIKAVQILKDNLPRTIVSLTGMLNVNLLRPVEKQRVFCEVAHLLHECACEYEVEKTTKLCEEIMVVEREIQDSGIFDTSDDFTFVLQPFANGITQPPMNPNGVPSLQFFAPDCFHFSKFGHSNVAKHLWNTIIQPVGIKQTSVNLTDASASLNCPEKDCPLFRTTKNSLNCTLYMTPSELD